MFLSSELRDAYLRPLMICKMYHVCDLGKISESVREKSKRYIQNGDDIDRTDNCWLVVLRLTAL